MNQVTLATSIIELNELGIMSVRARNVCYAAEVLTLAQLLRVDIAQLLAIRNCGVKTVNEIQKIQKRYSELAIDVPLIDDENETDFDINELDERKRKYLKEWQQTRYARLSERVKEKYYYSDIEAVLSFCLRKNEGRIREKYSSKLKAEWSQYLNDVEVYLRGVKEKTTEEILFDIISQEYPFLQESECKSIVEFEIANGCRPYLYIIKKSLQQRKGLKECILCDYYGLDSSCARQTREKIASAYNLTAERVRQIIRTNLSLPESLLDVTNELRSTIGLIAPYKSRIFENIQKANMLEDDVTETAYLVCAILGEYYVSVELSDGDGGYLVDRELLVNIKMKTVLRELCRVIELQRTQEEFIDIYQLLTREKKEYSQNVHLLCGIIADYIRKKYRDLEVLENRYVFSPPNKMNVPKSIVEILEQNGAPMNIDELWDAYNAINPFSQKISLATFKIYLSKTTGVKSKGKNGIYVLEKWENQFIGNLTDYLAQVVQACQEPITLDELTTFAKEQFPRTNKKSIYSLIIGDKANRFVLYEDGYVGIVTGVFANSLKFKQKRRFERLPFEHRFGQFQNFVITHRRLPFSVGADEETSLYRWMANVQKGIKEASEYQKKMLQDFLNENRTLPQNKDEENFREMCNRLKIMLKTTFSLPVHSENPNEYSWFRKNLGEYRKYSDNRREYFEDLLTYLKDFGFYY